MAEALLRDLITCSWSSPIEGAQDVMNPTNRDKGAYCQTVSVERHSWCCTLLYGSHERDCVKSENRELKFKPCCTLSPVHTWPKALCLKRTGAFRLQPGITEPAGQVWLTWHRSLDYCCDCQHAVFSFFTPHFLTPVPFDSSKPECADGLCSRVSVCIFHNALARREGGKMLNHASISMKCIFIH